MLLALYPQFNLWRLRGAEWNGSYAYNDLDEVAYAAYLNALREGRPRRNDPYTGRDDKPGQAQPESLFSIQFLPPYLLAMIARATGMTTSWAMILASVIGGVGAALALFWLIAALTKDARLAATGTLCVLCFGTLACAQGAVGYFFGDGPAYPYLPFLRRYLPAVPFPFFFIMCALVWRALTKEDRRAALLSAVGAGLSFAVLVFSYFYLWTSAAAWLALLALLWLLARPLNWRRDVKAFAVTGGLALAALAPYAYMLSQRATTMDDVQLLTLTRAPDLFRPPLLIGLAVCLTLAWANWRGLLRWRERAVLFTASLALVPLLVFNQQVITGRSLQPIHYEVFIVNYVALAAAALAAALLWRGPTRDSRRTSNRLLACIALAAFAWGVFEAKVTTDAIAAQNVIRDEAVVVDRRLAELARAQTNDATNDADAGTFETVLSTNFIHADSLPTTAPQAVLWARHQHIFASVTPEENRDRLFQLFYYIGADENWMRHTLEENVVIQIALFGWGRLTDRLTVNAHPITRAEVEAEVERYGQFIAAFDHERASHPLLAFVVTPADGATDLKNIDRWYERDAGERLGQYMLYRLKLRP
ncbi:MAG: hypothetical protein QOF02_2047 [Blastocatellia bacterium]|jgi:hypothetical protein|nr:hypothetical protein [Blastocatellia bacterium]